MPPDLRQGDSTLILYSMLEDEIEGGYCMVHESKPDPRSWPI